MYESNVVQSHLKIRITTWEVLSYYYGYIAVSFKNSEKFKSSAYSFSCMVIFKKRIKLLKWQFQKNLKLVFIYFDLKFIIYGLRALLLENSFILAFIKSNNFQCSLYFCFSFQLEYMNK